MLRWMLAFLDSPAATAYVLFSFHIIIFKVYVLSVFSLVLMRCLVFFVFFFSNGSIVSSYVNRGDCGLF